MREVDPTCLNEDPVQPEKLKKKMRGLLLAAQWPRPVLLRQELGFKPGPGQLDPMCHSEVAHAAANTHVATKDIQQ